MDEAIGDLLMLAFAVAVTPIPIVLMTMVLGGAHGRPRGIALLAGWVAGLVLVGAVVLVVAPEGSDADPPTWASVARLLLGLALWWLALAQWRDRSREDEATHVPGWAGSIDRASGSKLAAFGFLSAAANPKTLVLAAAAATSIARTDASTAEQAGAYLVFVVIGSIGTVTPLVVSLALGERADAALARMKEWLLANSAAIIAVLFAAIGAKLVGDAIGGLIG